MNPNEIKHLRGNLKYLIQFRRDHPEAQIQIHEIIVMVLSKITPLLEPLLCVESLHSNIAHISSNPDCSAEQLAEVVDELDKIFD